MKATAIDPDLIYQSDQRIEVEVWYAGKRPALIPKETIEVVVSEIEVHRSQTEINELAGIQARKAYQQKYTEILFWNLEFVRSEVKLAVAVG